MESGKHALHGIVVSNKIQPFLVVSKMWQVAGNNDKWQQDMGRKIKSKRLNEILPVI